MNCPTCDQPCPYTFTTPDITPSQEWAHNARRYVVCRGADFVHFRAIYDAVGGDLEVHRLALLAGSELAEAHEQARREVARIGIQRGG